MTPVLIGAGAFVSFKCFGKVDFSGLQTGGRQSTNRRREKGRGRMLADDFQELKEAMDAIDLTQNALVQIAKKLGASDRVNVTSLNRWFAGTHLAQVNILIDLRFMQQLVVDAAEIQRRSIAPVDWRKYEAVAALILKLRLEQEVRGTTA